MSTRKLCLFDLDRTLLQGRTIEHLARRFGVEEGLEEAFGRRKDEPNADTQESQRIMALFAGVQAEAFEAACAEPPLRPEAVEVAQDLREQGYLLAIATAGYGQAARAAARRLGAAWVACLEPEVKDRRLTGRLLPSPWTGPCDRSICKANVVRAFRFSLDAGPIVAVGDGRNDVCMFETADLAVAVRPCHAEAAAAADHVVDDLRGLVPLAAAPAFGPAAATAAARS